MDKNALDRYIRNTNPSALYIDGFDEAIIGTTTFRDVNGNRTLIAYSVQRVLELLAQQNPEMSASQLTAHADLHFFDSFEGDNTPIFVDQFSQMDIDFSDSDTLGEHEDDADEEISTAQIIAATEAYMNLAEVDPEFEKLLDEHIPQGDDEEKPVDPPAIGEHENIDIDPKDLYEF